MGGEGIRGKVRGGGCRVNESPLDTLYDFFGEAMSLRDIGAAVHASPAKIFALSDKLGLTIQEAATRPDVGLVCNRWIADAFRVNYQTFVSRIKSGMSPEDAAVAPVKMTSGLELVGRRFGMLRVVAEGPKGGRARKWECKCSCGRTVTVAGHRLVDGSATSCGCKSAPRRKWDGAVAGATFGRLTLMYVVEPNSVRRYPRWRCRCACGRIADVDEGRLRSGGTKSCGCLRKEITRLRGKMNARVVEIFGEQLTLDELASLSGLHKATLALRIKGGASPEDAAFR